MLNIQITAPLGMTDDVKNRPTRSCAYRFKSFIRAQYTAHNHQILHRGRLTWRLQYFLYPNKLKKAFQIASDSNPYAYLKTHSVSRITVSGINISWELKVAYAFLYCCSSSWMVSNMYFKENIVHTKHIKPDNPPHRLPQAEKASAIQPEES